MKLYDKPKLMDILQNKGPVLFKTINVRKKEKKLKDCFRLKETKDMKTKMQQIILEKMLLKDITGTNEEISK